MNVFQNLLDVFVLYDIYEPDSPIVGATKTEAEAIAEKARLYATGGSMFIKIVPRRATNIGGQWYVLSETIEL
jgi:hypothetical protein